MPSPQSPSLGSLHPDHSFYTTPRADIAPLSYSIDPSRPERLQYHDPFAHYKAFLDTRSSSGRSENDAPCNIELEGHQLVYSEMNSVRDVVEPSSKEHSVTRNITARLGTQSTSLPLATIIEQCSLSTLQSHESLHGSLGRDLLVQPSHTTQLASTSLQLSRRLDESAVYRIQEHYNRVYKAYQPIVDHARPLPGTEMPCTDPRPAAPINNISRPRQLLPASQYQVVSQGGDCKGLKGLLRGVMQGESRSFIPKLPSTETSAASESMPRDLRHQIGEQKLNNLLNATTQRADFFSSSAGTQQLPPSETPGNIAEANDWSSRSSNANGLELSTIRHVFPGRVGEDAMSTYNPERLLFPSLNSTVRDHVRPSTDIPPDISSLHHCREDTTSRYTFDGVPLHRSNAPSPREHGRAREPSFCSTVSSSYSGTVLGVDLDLQQNFPSTAHHSSSMWLDASAPPHASQQVVTTTRPSPSDRPRTITSSALPVLLPLAASSGIVKPNYAVPHLSFYSPSGNLIQTETPEYSSSNTIYHQSARLPFSEPSFKSRPANVCSTTPPHSSIPLPAHLRQQRKNQQHHENMPSRIFPQLRAKSSVKGRGGVIKHNSRAPRSGVLLASLGTKFRSNKPSNPTFNWSYSSSIHNGRLQCHTVALCTSRSKKTNSKAKESPRTLNAATRPGPMPARHRHSEAHGGKAEIGPFAAWALRICFCQPWHGAGDRRCTRVDGSQCLGDSYSDDAHAAINDTVENIPARVVSR